MFRSGFEFVVALSWIKMMGVIILIEARQDDAMVGSMLS